MQVYRPRPVFSDARGAITDVLARERIDFVTVIDSVAGAVRGNHYHKETTQWVYVTKGRLRLLAQVEEDPIEETVLEVGDLALTPPMEKHAMIAIEDASFMVFTRGPRGGEDYEKDTYRLEQPLRRN